MQILRDKVFCELLAKTFGAHISCIDADGYFEVISYQELPSDLSQMSVKLTVAPQNPAVIDHNKHPYSSAKYTYWFHPTAQSTFEKVLANELEKKRYQEFSQTFDKEVQSELEQ